MFRILLHQLPQRLFLPYRGYLWIWHVIAAGVTALIVLTGFDWWFFRQTRNEFLLPLVMVGGLGGMVMPVIIPLFLYIRGKKRKDINFIRTAVAFTQASIIAWIIVAIYKVFTGRIQPDFLFAEDANSVSSGFQFGFFEHGIFWGWPSHHTVVAVAGATVLYLALKHPVARFGALIWAGIVAAGAAVGFHWFSDMVAGVIVGIVVGFALWRNIQDIPLVMKEKNEAS